MENTDVTPLKQVHKSKRFVITLLSGIFWALVWPIIAFGLFCLFLLFISLALADSRYINEPSEAFIRFILFILGLSIGIIFFVVIRLLNRLKRRFFVTGRLVLAGYTILGLIVTQAVVIGFDMPEIPDNGINAQLQVLPTKPEIKQDIALTSKLEQLVQRDEDINDVSLQYSNHLSCSLEKASGCYKSYVNLDGSLNYGQIEISEDLNTEEENRILAHEYLHHVWAKHIERNPSLRNKITSDLITMHGRDNQFQNRVETYSDNGILIPTELFSYYCTESSDFYLSESILSECNKYIDRSKLKLIR